MAGNWSDYEHNCENMLSWRYTYTGGNVSIIPEGQHNAYKADAGVLIGGQEAFSVEFKSVQSAGDKCTMAPFTMTDESDGRGLRLLELTDSAYQKVNDLEGMLELACEIQERSEEIIPMDGKTAYVNKWTQYAEEDEYEFAWTSDESDANFKMCICMMASDFYRSCKGATWFMIGETPFPFFNDWQHIYEYFDFYVQVRAKSSGGAKIPQATMAKLESELYASRIPDDEWYSDNGRLYISENYNIATLFNDWSSDNVFSIQDVNGAIKKINCKAVNGWYHLKPHPTNLTVMPYGIYNGRVPDIDQAWNELDKYVSRCGGIF